MAFTEIETIKNVAGVNTTSYTDGEIQDFISMAQKEVTSKVQQKIIRERVLYLDNTRQNRIDGLNSTYYLSKWKGNYLGDLDYDGDIDTDDIKVYQIASDGTETELTVSSINSDNMSFVLGSIPAAGVVLEVTYTYSPYNMNGNVDPFLAQITTFLACSYFNITDGSDEPIRFGNVSIGGSSSGIKGNKYYQKYMELLNQLIENSTGGAIWGESLVKI